MVPIPAIEPIELEMSGSGRLLPGSVGALESTVQSEVEIEDLADLGSAWEKLDTI